MNLPGLVEAGSEPVFQESEEGVDRGKPSVAGAGGVASFPFNVLEKCKHQRRGQLLHSELPRFDAEAACGKADEELEAVGIGIASVWACPPFIWQMLTQEDGEMGRERCHGAPLVHGFADLGNLCHEDRGGL